MIAWALTRGGRPIFDRRGVLLMSLSDRSGFDFTTPPEFYFVNQYHKVGRSANHPNG